MKHQDQHTPAFLVAIDGTHVLVDAARERLFMLNAAAAEVWRCLVAGTPPQTPLAVAFAAELVALGLLPETVTVASGKPVPRPGEPEPRIIARASLQVAANTSDPNPFSSDTSW